MLRYGIPKIKDLKENAKDFSNMGFKPGLLWGTPMALLESFGGAAMILGFAPKVIAMLFGFMMLVGSIWKSKKGKSYGTISYDLVLFIQCMIVLFFGAGYYSLYQVEVPALQWGMLLGAIVAGAVLAFLPEILGEKYRKWKG